MVGLINDLYDAIAAGVGKEVIEGIIDEVVSYTSFHLTCEERLFDLTNYAEAETHQKEHDVMRAWAKGVQDEYNKGTLLAPSLEVMVYLKDWLFDHILISDQKYAPYLKEMGVQ
jgi:methyl-accepting chemotaxis protein/hemerythrin